MDFHDLAGLQREIAVLQRSHAKALKHYHIDNFCGFRHKYYEDDPKKHEHDFSKASTATCVLSLTLTGRWTDELPWYEKTQLLINELLKCEWTSADLNPENPFTVAHIIEAAAALRELTPEWQPDESASAAWERAEAVLSVSLRGGAAGDGVEGAAHLVGYPPSTYLTQLVVRVVQRLGKLDDGLRKSVRNWALSQVEHELALIYTESKLADPYALAYGVVLVSATSATSELTPDVQHILRKSVDKVFDTQLEDGSWPRSRPLFHYPKFGNAYCYEYEMLVQLLAQEGLREHCLRHLDNLGLASHRLRETAYQLQRGALGWASDHHPQLKGPESWSTASVFHFLHMLDRVLAEAVRRKVFEYVGCEYRPPEEPPRPDAEFALNLLDSDIQLPQGPLSLKEAIGKFFVLQVAQNAPRVVQGRSMPAHVPIAAIFFGPPGTAKTTLAKEIASCLGWPLLTIDPSHLLRRGLDQLQAETNTIFSMVAALERVVVLLDEFDEMLRERTEEASEAMSRFLTTAMLPKLALINDRRRILVIVATNHVQQFDFAIRRPGRFDLLVQVMPPRLDEKFRWWPRVEQKCRELSVGLNGKKTRATLEELTYAEFEELARRLETAESKAGASAAINVAGRQSTLRAQVRKDASKCWFDLCKEQLTYVRIPGLDVSP